MSMRSAAKYILDGAVNTVDGWLGGGAITATLAINDWQRRHDVSGNVAEIGIHHGKFFLVLKNLCRDDECSIAVDVFDDQELNVDRSGRGDRAIFESNLAAHSDGKNVEIIQGDSKLLTPDRILEAGRDERIRLFSVDGSHTTEYTLSDLLLASDVLDDNGVIALDDFYSQYWPGVQEGFHHFMSKRSPEFKALAIGNNKLFICKRAAHSELLKIFKESLYPYYLEYKDVTVWGSDAVSMALPEPTAVFSSDLLLPTNVFALSAGRCSPRCDLRHGWSHFEADGTWTIGKQALVELQLVDPPTSGTATLGIKLAPFIHSRRKARRIDVFVNNGHIATKQLSNIRAEWIDLPIDAAILTERTTIAIEIEEPEKPSEIGLSSDPRSIGVKVGMIKLSSQSGFAV